MRFGILALAAMGALSLLSQTTHAAVVTAAAASTYDSDGDGVTDLTDNAPGAYEPAQFDTDGDQIGDIIDPMPAQPGPWINIGFGIGGTYNTTPGSGVTINYSVTNAPVGKLWSHRVVSSGRTDAGMLMHFKA